MNEYQAITPAPYAVILNKKTKIIRPLKISVNLNFFEFEYENIKLSWVITTSIFIIISDISKEFSCSVSAKPMKTFTKKVYRFDVEYFNNLDDAEYMIFMKWNSNMNGFVFEVNYNFQNKEVFPDFNSAKLALNKQLEKLYMNVSNKIEKITTYEQI